MVFYSQKTVRTLILVVALTAVLGFGIHTHAQTTSDGTTTGPDGSTVTNTAGPDGQIPDDLNTYDTGINEGDIDASASPENPGSFQRVTISLDSNLVDIRRYVENWFVDGKLAQRGYGKLSLTTTTKDYGQPTIVRVSIELPTGTVTKNITLTPEDISTIWEAVDSYVPPFYQGKKLPAREGIVRIVAIPNFLVENRPVSPSELVYNWKRNDNVVTGGSAYGLQSLLIKNNKIRPTESIQVTASTLDSAQQATTVTNIPFYDPKILFYDLNPDTGNPSPFSKSSLFFKTQADTVIAEPFFFSISNAKLQPLKFSWTMNDETVQVNDINNRQMLTLRNPGGSGGTAMLGLSIDSASTYFQTASSQLPIVFSTP